MLVFLKANKLSLLTLCTLLEELKLNTGLTINIQKSKIYFSKGCSCREELKAIIGFPEGLLPTKYLGMPLSEKYLKHRHFSSLIDKCKEKLKDWKSQTLSFPGRVELIRSVIHGIVSYWIQSYQLPASVCRELDSMYANFLWKGKMHAWSWKSICKPRSEGGMGLRSFQVVNKTFACKRFWTYCATDTIWAKWMRMHYKKLYSIENAPVHPMNSVSWKELCQIRQFMLSHMHYTDNKWQWGPCSSGLFTLKSA